MIHTFNAIIDMDLPANEKSLLLTILRHMNHTTGECFPSVETLMRKSGVKSKSTFLKVRKNLVEKGLLQYNQRGKNLYYMITLQNQTSTKPNQYKIDNEPVQNSSESGSTVDHKQLFNKKETENNNILRFIHSKNNPNFDYINGQWMFEELSSEFLQ